MTIAGWTERVARRIALTLIDKPWPMVARPERRSEGRGFIIGYLIDGVVLTDQYTAVPLTFDEAGVDAAADQLVACLKMDKPSMSAEPPRIECGYQYQQFFATEGGVIVRGIHDVSANQMRFDLLCGGREAVNG